MTPRLKSLELHGYKTFASRTLFEFPGDITAIVGPNGSGKSNIADSLRWVLGEQSYSLLRGRKTEDMIFSGSEHRSRASMASAAITFSNEDGWLPIDFNEVSIARRAYRDGQNEYLLNGQRVRLKEIAELLGKSGLAERTYTIIGQGLVDAALSLKPEERRRFFEEAAGIGLYRARREEALNRLDTTRRNLERVLDILSELEPRLNSLEKQARRAQEYEQIRADLRLLLRDWYGFKWHRVQKEIVYAMESVHVQEERLQRARERQAEVEVKLGDLRYRMQELRNDLNDWHAFSATLHNQWEKVSRNMAVMDERQRALLSQQQNLHNDLGRLEEEQKARQERLLILTGERDRLQTDLQEAEAQVKKARIQLEKRQAERGQIESGLRDLRRNLVQIETNQVHHTAHQNELTNRLETLRKNQRTVSDNLEKENALLGQLQGQVEKQAKMQQQVEQEKETAEEMLQSHRTMMAELETSRKQVQDERTRLEGEHARLAAQLDVLEQSEKSFSGLSSGAKYLLQEAVAGRLKGRYQAIGRQLIVPSEYETAIAAALGEFVDSVLVEGGTDPEESFRLLAKTAQGRALLLPEDWLRIPETLELPRQNGIIGLASELVEAPEHLKNILRLLLGNVLVVRDREEALKLAKSLPAEARLVSLQGEVFYATGVVAAGTDNRTATIGRPRMIQELQTALASADHQLMDVKQKLIILETDLDQHRDQDRELGKSLRQVEHTLNQVQQDCQRTALNIEQVRQRHDFQARQQVDLESQFQRVEQEIQKGKAEIEGNTKKIADINEQIRGQQRVLSGLPVDELQAEVVHWSTGAAVASRALKDAGQRLTEYRESLESAERQAETQRQRLQETSDGLARLKHDIQTLQEEENQLNGQIENLHGKIEPAESQLQDVEKEYNSFQTNLMVAQQNVTVSERHTTQAQLELSRLRESQESLRRRVEEDFGLVVFEQTPEVYGPTPLPLQGMVEQLPVLHELSPDVEENINRQRALLRRMGPINPDVQQEYQSVKDRYAFLTNQVIDLRKADADLREVIIELDVLMRREFRNTFDAVASEFRGMFTRLFGGGSARLVLSDDENPTEAGIEIEARLPGRREQGLSLLSGGERSLTAVALIFSLLKVSPTPFCVLDEVDAMLDESNVGRFRDLLVELSGQTQFILVTHNRNTVQAANVIYGVTMGRDSASQVISLRLDEVSDELVK